MPRQDPKEDVTVQVSDKYANPAAEARSHKMRRYTLFCMERWKKFVRVCALPLVALGTVAVLLVAMIPSYYVIQSPHDASEDILTFPSNLTVFNYRQFSQVSILTRITEISTEDFTCFVVCNVGVGGSYLSDEVPASARLNAVETPLGYQYSLTVNGVQLQLITNQPLQDLSVGAVMREDEPRDHYPFDRYTVNLRIISVLVPNPESNHFDADNPTLFPVPVGITMVAGAAGYDTSAVLTAVATLPNTTVLSADGSSQAHSLYVTVTVQRSLAVKIFSIFIVIIMWALSLSMFATVIDNLFIRRVYDVSYESAGLALTMLFAMPFVRDVQPGIPPVGVTVDMVGFFWNMGLIAVTTIMLMYSITIQPAQEHESDHSNDPSHLSRLSGQHVSTQCS